MVDEITTETLTETVTEVLTKIAPLWPTELVTSTFIMAGQNEKSCLYIRVHFRMRDSKGIPGASVFDNSPKEADGKSTDWNKYSSPKKTRLRAKIPQENGVIEVPVELVRQQLRKLIEDHSLPELKQNVAHTPNCNLDNRSHTDILGTKSQLVRMKLRDIFINHGSWKILHTDPLDKE